MIRRGKHAAPRPRGRETLRFGRALPLALALVLLTALVAWADQAEGDFASGGTSRNVTAGETFSFNADLYIVRSGTAAETVSWTGPVVQDGNCAGITGTNNPAGFTMPDPAWHNTANNTKSTTFDATKKSTVTISGTAGAAGDSCTLRYTASATRAPSASGNPMPEGQSRVDFTINFVAPAVTNSQPQVAADAASVTINEGSLAQMTGTWSDADAGDNVTLTASVGSVVKVVTGPDNSGTWSWSHTPDDGPSDSQMVTITANDNTGTANATNTATFQLNVDNVAPTASASPSSLNALSGVALSFEFSAIDPSNTDTLAGFDWRFNDGQGGGYGSFESVTPTGVSPATPFTPSATYADCGSYTATAQARDKDLGESNQPTVAVSVYDSDFHGAIKPAMRNMVQKGRVVPVQTRIGCGGTALTGLSPAIQLQRGDVDPDTGDTSWTNIVTESVSGADTTGVMRAVDGGYIYNLLIPNTASAGQQYTIKVYPWGAPGPSLMALVEIRK